MITKTKKHLKTYITMVITLITILFISTNSYADKPKVITIDYAYYNPVSLLLASLDLMKK